MTNKYNFGDKITVEGTVVGNYPGNILTIDVTEGKILSHTPVIKVGDKVHCKPYSDEIFDVLGIDKNYFWIKRKDYSPFTVDISRLTKIEDTSNSQWIDNRKLSRLIEDR